jgi:hypothetical protein
MPIKKQLFTKQSQSCDEYGEDIVGRGFPSDIQFFPHRQIPE